MATQGETSKCFFTGCTGTMTFHEKLKSISGSAPPKVVPSNMVNGRPDKVWAGWLCDANEQHFSFLNP